MLGRPEADGHLKRIAATAANVDDPADLARAARALRALGQAQEANAVYRDAVGGRGTRSGHQHGVG